MSAKEFRKIHYRLSRLEDFISLWADFFHFFSDTQEELDDSEPNEEIFQESARDLARELYPIQELAQPHFSDTDRIYKILREFYSLKHLREIAEAAFEKHQVEWHEIYLNLNKARGKFLHEMTPKQLEEYEETRGGGGGAAHQGSTQEA